MANCGNSPFIRPTGGDYGRGGRSGQLRRHECDVGELWGTAGQCRDRQVAGKGVSGSSLAVSFIDGRGNANE